jgi:ABC-type Mn2+/Zn2+ transport system ATPase subunit
MDKKKLIELENVSLGYENIPFLAPISLAIERDQFWGILGPNGGGKTTLLKTILGLIPSLSGEIRYQDKIVFGYVPQREEFDRLFPISLGDLVMMGRYSRITVGRKAKKEDWEIVDDYLDKVDITHVKDRPFRSVSGGEKQRALLARAFAGKPDVLVLDEPTASVDIRGEAEIMRYVETIRKEEGMSVLMVSHFINTVSRFSDHIILIDKDNGLFDSGLKEDVLKGEVLTKVFDIPEGPDRYVNGAKYSG